MRSPPRKLYGMLMLIAGIAVYAWAIASLSLWIGRLHVLAQAGVYLLAGIAWVPLMFPLARYIQTGRFLPPRRTAKPGENGTGDAA